MRVLNAIQRILLLLLLIPVLAICLDTLLRAFKAQRTNPIVSGVRDFASTFLIEPFKTVFPNQSYLQDALVALAAFGILALLIVFIFRGLRSMVGTRPPRAQPATATKPATKPAPTATASTESTGTADGTTQVRKDDTSSPSST